MITVIILAAGESRRMGQPKLILPWGKSTVLQTVISTFREAGLDDILVVSGGARRQVEALVTKPVEIVHNPDYARGEMLSSIQAGLSAKKQAAEAALIALGDQPQIQKATVVQIVQEYQKTRASIIVPSYHMHRGHPWLVAQELWQEILTMKAPETLREFLIRHENDIRYIPLDTPSLIQDLDTPDDYLKYKP